MLCPPVTLAACWWRLPWATVHTVPAARCCSFNPVTAQVKRAMQHWCQQSGGGAGQARAHLAPTDLVYESSTTELPLTSLPGSSSPHTLAMLPATRHPPPSQAPPRSRPSPQVPADSQASSISGAAGAAAKARAAAQARLAIAQAAVAAGVAAPGPPAALAALEAVETVALDSSGPGLSRPLPRVPLRPPPPPSPLPRPRPLLHSPELLM
ncbi:hypothetical protein HaLaN_16807 [Haematococcus lacustris]|uniref:Uncharacterized protein n=1 Tax=Haematococcus lacustris TaxID=44745 RepID=A0A699ZV21_HAELA|nr:hypothetical protein HaLaN_16807 [Haematococcus lacustris]